MAMIGKPDIAEWRAMKRVRGVEVGMMYQRHRPEWQNRYHAEKKRIKEAIDFYSGGALMRDLCFKLMNDQALDHRIYTPDHEMYADRKKVMRRRIEQVRSMRIACGLPRVFNDFAYPFYVDSHSQYVPHDYLKDMQAAGIELHERVYVMSGPRAHRLVSSNWIKRKGHGLWTYYDNIHTNDDANGCKPWTFAFASHVDFIEFRMLFDEVFPHG